MSKKSLYLLPTILWASFFICGANNPVRAAHISEETLTELASSDFWLKLIKVTRESTHRFSTDLLSDNFYLASGSPPSPLDELNATVRTALAKLPSNESHTQCRFPARVHWLKSQLPNFATELPQIHCASQKRWLETTEDKRFYLAHVSGYFGNPASAFGHLILRIGDGVSKRGLMDTGINFGAKIPPADGSLTYMLKGLFGGYTASFSSKEHYLQDKVYSDTESRDMWAYELNLSSEQSQILRFHLWELIDQPFKYFFLKENCAYRIAELLDLVFDSHVFVNDRRPYYAPIQLFDKLEHYDRKHNGNVIKQVEFIPSHKRESFDAFGALDLPDALQANAILEEGRIDTTGTPVSVQSLDFLLEYLDYKIQSTSTNENQPLRLLKQQTVRERFRHPPNATSITTTEKLATPGGGPRPAAVRLSFTEANGGASDTSSVALEVSPFRYDTLDQNRGSLIDSGFKALSLRLKHQDGQLKFDQLTLLDIQKFTANEVSIYGESALAWRGGARIENRSDCATTCPVGRFSGSLGRSTDFYSGVLYATADASLTTSLAEQQIGISAGSLYNFPHNIRGHWRSGYILYSKKQQRENWSHEIQLQKSIGINHSVDVTFAHVNRSSFSLGYKYKW